MHAVVLGAFFGQGFFHVMIWLGIAFMYGFALLELFRSGSRGWVKAVWALVIIGIPIAGAIAYLLVSPSPVLDFNPVEGKPMSPGQRAELDYDFSQRPIG